MIFYIRYFFFNIRDSVHRSSRLKKSNEMQQYADIYLLLNLAVNKYLRIVASRWISSNFVIVFDESGSGRSSVSVVEFDYFHPVVYM